MTSDFIKVYDNALPVSLCGEIIDRFDGDRDHHYVGAVSTPEGFETDLLRKQATELDVSNCDGWADIDSRLYSNLSHYFNEYTSSLGDLFKCTTGAMDDQAYRIKRYGVGGGFDWHIDTTSMATSGRWIAAQWYFNTVYQGGETEFMNSGKTIRPVTGRLVFFPSTWTHMHRSVPTYSGPKYICTTFFSPRWLHRGIS